MKKKIVKKIVKKVAGKVVKEKDKVLAITIRMVKLNNKSRKGEYIYFRDSKTKKQAYYKFKKGMSIDDSLEYFKEKQKGRKLPRRASIFSDLKRRKREGTLDKKAEMTIRKYKLFVDQKTKITEALKKGYSETNFDLLKAGNKTVKQVYRELFGPLVINKNLLGAVIKNAEKFKGLLFFKVDVFGIDEEGNMSKLAEITDTNKSVKEMVEKYKSKLKEGTIITSYMIQSVSEELQTISAIRLHNGIVKNITVNVSCGKKM